MKNLSPVSDSMVTYVIHVVMYMYMYISKMSIYLFCVYLMYMCFSISSLQCTAQIRQYVDNFYYEIEKFFGMLVEYKYMYLPLFNL